MMEFHEKLQALRKRKGLTQEDLAGSLYVSRTAISKWESGRGLPNIESLKAISAFFGVSLDELLSGDDLLTIAEEENREKERRSRSLIFGLLDCSAALLFLLPLFGRRAGEEVRAVSLTALPWQPLYVKLAFLVLAAAQVLWGVLLLALQNSGAARWLRWKDKVSLALSAAATLAFLLGRHPYAAVFAFVFLAVKALTLIKWG